MATYQVVAECAHVTTDGGLRLLYKGAMVPDDCDPERVKHLLRSGLVKEVKSVEETPLAPNAAVVPDEFATTGGAKVEPESGESEVDRKRSAARAKLPTDGSAPDGRASDAVLVEYLVGKGYDRGEVEKASSSELRKLAKDAASK